MSIVHFIKYNNAVPITLGVLFLGAGSAFAMSPEVRDATAAAVYSSQQQVVSIDNTYIVNKDLETYAPKAQITEVTEDDEYYYVQYSLSTIKLADYVWQDVVEERTMKVSKADLGQYRDLGVYVTEQIRQVVSREIAMLKEVQQIEKKQQSQKTVATKYGGLVGALLDEKTETLAGYTPVVTERPASQEWTRPTSGGGDSGAGTAGSGSVVIDNSPSSPVVLNILGSNPARIALRSTYSDLGAVVTVDGKVEDYSVHTLLDGTEVDYVSIDTSTSTRYIVTYRATDRDGNTGEAQRVILVGDAELGDIVIKDTSATTGSQNDSSDDGVGADTQQDTPGDGQETATTTEQTSDDTIPEDTATTTDPVVDTSGGEDDANATTTPSETPDTATTTPAVTQGEDAATTPEVVDESAGEEGSSDAGAETATTTTDTATTTPQQ